MKAVDQIAVVGLGYVGLPIAIAFAKQVKVVGFDINELRIQQYQDAVECTGKIGNIQVPTSNIEFTSDENKLKDIDFFVIAVPTPVHNDHCPDLRCLEGASQIVGRQMKKGAVIVYESTVYPGCTEEICLPILEKASGLKCPEDFKIGYSPERINPGDNANHLLNIVKILSGIDGIAVERIKKTYELILEKEPFVVSNIKTAEAIKLIENSQRDINIAFMNEIAILLNRLEIDTDEVMAGMRTKWNALHFTPGLVGGHCIGIDPYYLTYIAERMGIINTITANARIINEKMSQYIAEIAIKQLVLAGKVPKLSKVVILGFTYKENCDDIRNSKVADIVEHLKTYEVNPVVVDPVASGTDVLREYGISISGFESVKEVDCLIIAVAHDLFKNLSSSDVIGLLKGNKGGPKNVVIDVKRIFSADEFPEDEVIYFGI